MGRGSAFISLGALVIFGIILADLVANPTGTQGAAKGVSTVLTPSYNALLGKTS